ncbi:prepilin-type N-terminal cleavage/methylation domain-containing protein [Clostridium neuense]|uniref:Prepilin-type N-terminal cleavage/methylation domain-containing protein n=1 Tax=Clostridium neuense TaxID=1728934 RepID=A0ABW8TH03_9CLOT
MNKTKGFTLIELITTISIILILSSMLVPNVLGYIKKTYEAKAQDTANLVFSSAMESYMKEDGFIKEDVEECLSENLKIKDINFSVCEPSDEKSINVDFKYKDVNYEVQINGEDCNYVFKKS